MLDIRVVRDNLDNVIGKLNTHAAAIIHI